MEDGRIQGRVHGQENLIDYVLIHEQPRFPIKVQ
jgi:hypothetical protein